MWSSTSIKEIVFQLRELLNFEAYSGLNNLTDSTWST